MAANSLAPQNYSPDRETPWMAVGLLVAAAVFGLWRGIASQLTEERVGSLTAPAADAASPRAAAALPAVAASTDTLIPPEAQATPAALVTTAPTPRRAPAAAPAPEARPAAEPERSAASMTPDDPRLAPAPSLQILDEESAPPADFEEPPPEIDEPYD